MKKEEPAGLKSTTHSSPSPAIEYRNYKNNNKKRSNKGLCCPFACPNCQSLGGDLVKSKYEIINILSDTGDSIFSPMHEQYHDEDHKSAIRNDGGKVFLSADLVVVDSLFQQKYKK
jgi:hypothetical protein